MKMGGNKDEIQHLLYECISKLPEKYTLYATLIGLVNVRNYNFVVEVSIEPFQFDKYFLNNFQFIVY
jgi:hypothetical protein